MPPLCHKMRHIETTNLIQKYFVSCENLFCGEVVTILMEIQLEIRKLEAKNTLPEYHKTRFDSKLFFLKKKLRY